MVSHFSLSNSKSPQVSRTLLGILADLNNAIILMVPICSLISKYSSLWNNLLVNVPSAPITAGITVTFMFYSFFRSLARSSNLPHFSLVFNFTLWSAWTAKSTIRQVLFVYWLSLDLVVWQRLGDLFVSQNPRGVWATYSSGQILGCT